MRLKIIFIAVVLTTIFFSNVKAQKAILFQIPSSSAQIKYETSRGNDKAVAQYKRSDNQIKHAIYRNFKEFFTYCPVYFFSSSDYEHVKNHKLQAVTFYNNLGKEVSLPTQLSDYKVANISFYPKVTKEITKEDGSVVLEESSEDHFGIGIIMNDTTFNPVLGKLRFTPCKIFKRGSIFNRSKRYYEFRGAQSLNRKLLKHGTPPKTTP